MADLAVVGILLIMIGAAVRYLFKARKGGAKCIGCHGGCKAGGCGCPDKTEQNRLLNTAMQSRGCKPNSTERPPVQGNAKAERGSCRSRNGQALCGTGNTADRTGKGEGKNA